MSFFGKFKTGSTQTGSASKDSAAKKDPNAPQPTPLEKHLADACLYYSAPFRDHVINFPSKDVLESIRSKDPNGAPLSPRATSTTPYPNPTSPARKQNVPGSPGPQGQQKPEESKDSPEYRKRMALQNGPVLDMTYDNSAQYGMDESLFTSLRDIFEGIIGNQSRIGVVSPHRFLEILRRENEMFRSAMHQDAHEFLNLLLNQVVDNVEMFSKQHPALMAPPQANGGAPEKIAGTELSVSTNGLKVHQAGLDTHWVHDLFEGLLTSETRCLTCENTSQRDEAFLDLSVDLSAHTSVTSCLRKFSEEEMLCERNKFHCDNCGGLQEAEKRMKIKRLPRILALHLKRFKYTEDLQRLQKLFHRVVYPFHLRLFNTTDDAEDPDRLYELYAVVVHIGGGPYHGHYVSIVKTQDRGWLLFDDELVEPVDKSYVMNFFGGEPQPGVQDAKQLACAYVLFYQETTLEAVLKEQEAERGAAAMPTRTSDVETSKDPSSPIKNGDGLAHVHTATTPSPHDMEHMDMLAHAATAPQMPNLAAAANARPHLDHLQSTPLSPVMPTKTKKELKQEEKEREKAAKAAKKAEEKALDEKRQEASRKRQEAWKRQDEEMKAVMEMSKQTAADEAKTRGEEAPKEKEKESGFSRFRHGSMSLRKKPTMFGKDKEKNKEEKLPPVPQNGTVEVPNGTAPPPNGAVQAAQAAAEKSATRDSMGAPPAVQAVQQQEEKTKKNRFSLGRKKSTLIG
ncbi:hypothetical protein PRZ48_009695 [Zasmidium cellare]|uniref:ubiquitinyl hydrolase 1 n=1 Tax=Zasmidium cellare TaxID=395010 RepID=A0ABR0ECI1_ZASCE|nr:hypothetical protein PRZ48_009695 [Zasmidium cellare]